MDKRFAQLNLAALILWGAGLLIENLSGLPWLRWAAASFSIFFLPGWNISYLLFPKLFSVLERILFALLVSSPVIALSLYTSHFIFQIPFSANFVKIGTAAILIGSFVGVTRSRRDRVREDKERIWPLFAALGIYLALAVVIFVIYPFIPEADPYFFLRFSQETLETGQFPLSSFRQPFIALTTALSVVGNIPLGAVFKVILPLLGTMMLPPIFLIARQYLRDRIGLLLATITPLAAPVVMLESVTTRPQVVILFTLPGILYFLVRSLQQKSWWLAAAMLIFAVLLIPFHEMALLLTTPTLATLLVLFWPRIKKYPLRSIIFFTIGMLLAYPIIQSLGLVDLAKQIFLKISNSSVLTFRLWFLNNYTNIDRQEVGWPGWTALFYYAYNVGPLIPVLIAAFWVTKKKILWRSLVQMWPVLLIAGIFIIFAEILPRFGIGYYPDRMWPFITVTVSLAIPVLFQRLGDQFRLRFARILMILALLIGIGGTLYIAYAKQGWVTRREYRAALFLREHTPENSMVISQGGNEPLISYYANRSFIHADIFSSGTPLATVSEIRRLGLDHPGSIYVLYSFDKFNNLYGRRAWWRNMNYASADLTKFDDKKYFEKVYDDSQVFIWQVIGL